jgi:hypothetical protein
MRRKPLRSGAAAPEGMKVKHHSLKPRSKTDLSDVRASITMTAYLAEQMRSFGQSDLAKVYDLVASELLQRCETAVAGVDSPTESRLH